MTKEELLIQLEALAERADLEANAYAVLREHLDSISQGLDEVLAVMASDPTQTKSEEGNS